MRNQLLSAGLVAAVVLALAAVPYARDDDDDDDSHRARHVRAHLDGYHVIPTLSTTGRGRFVARIDDEERTIEYDLVYSGLEGGSATAAHIHFGMPWFQFGGMSVFLCGGGGKPPCPPDGVVEGEVKGVITPADVIGPTTQGIAPGEFDELVRAIRAGATYVDVHTVGRTFGEIRGQIFLSKNRDDN